MDIVEKIQNYKLVDILDGPLVGTKTGMFEDDKIGDITIICSKLDNTKQYGYMFTKEGLRFVSHIFPVKIETNIEVPENKGN